MTNIVEKITVKSASLPSELQHEILDFIEFITGRNRAAKRPFRRARGILKRDLSNLENDLADVRREMWRNFPREKTANCLMIK